MKVPAFLLTILFLALGASAQQDTTIQMQCRKLPSGGDVLHSDETFINGMACRQVKQSIAPKPIEKPGEPAAWFPPKAEPLASVKSATPATEARTGATVAQSGVNRQCLILKRMGPADQITSHMYSFGVRGKQFQYVEGDFPPGLKFHGRLTDHDIREIQNHNGRVVIMEPKYNADDLREAKVSCRQR
jgi:hypothetical protein